MPITWVSNSLPKQLTQVRAHLFVHLCNTQINDTRGQYEYLYYKRNLNFIINAKSTTIKD